MFDIGKISGNWPSGRHVVMTVVDRGFYQRFFTRWYDSFHRQFGLPLHVHIVDPTPEQQVTSLPALTVTWENTSRYEWSSMLPRYSDKDIPVHTQYHAVYEWYCQSIRYYIVHHMLQRLQSVIVTDADAVALRKPEKHVLNELCKKSQFSKAKGRVYANFCNIHKDDLAQAQELATQIKKGCLSGSKDGNDQVCLKNVFDSYPEMASGWTDQNDITDKIFLDSKLKNIVFHAKGTRGKDFKLPTS